ncbi:41393_t:CDS:10, partial [Gigaspora margarita]
GLLFEKYDKALLLEDTQTLILEYKKSQTKIYGLNRKISNLQKHIEELENKLDEKMTILNEISTEKYLSLVLTQPCPKCNNNSLINKSWNIIPIEFQVKSTIECIKCASISEYTNESKEILLTNVIAAIELAGGISRNAIQSSLAIIGITNQTSNKTYYKYQKMYFALLIASANLSIKEALQKCIKHTLSQGKKSLSVGFDCSWSHIRNANQTSEKLIYQEIPFARLVKDKRVVKTIHQDNFDKSSRQMEYTILIGILNQISPSLKEADLHLDICINGNLDSNKTLANIPIVSNIYTNLKHLICNIRNSLQNHIMRWFCGCIYSAALRHAAHDSHALTEEETYVYWTKDNPEIILQEPTLCHSSNNQINEFRKLFETTYCVSRAFNRVKLVYMDKKIDYWQSFAARHAMAILHYNEEYTYLLSELREIYCEKPFELADLHNINAIESARSAKQRWNLEKIQQHNKTRAEKYTNEHKELAVFYKKKALDQLHVNEFYSSFGPLIVDFDVTIRCICCKVFSKHSKGLCSLCYTYHQFGWSKRLINKEISLQKEINKPISLEEHIKIIAKEIFKFTELRPGQIDAIKYYVKNKKDTLVIMKTSRGKSFCYATASILFDGLIVNHFIKLEILCARLVTSSQGTIEYKSKVMEEIALGFTRLLYVTPEKLLLNSSLKKLYSHLHEKGELQFEWGKLGKLKEYFPKVQIMALTATLSQDNVYALRNNLNISEDDFEIAKGSDLLCKELCFSVQSQKENNLAWTSDVIILIKSIEVGCAIIYCSRIKDCKDVYEALNLKIEEIQLDIYHRQLQEDYKANVMKKWNQGKTYLMIATLVFGMGIDIPDVRLVLHYNCPMNMRQAGRDQKNSNCVILYAEKDIRTNYTIITGDRESNENNDKNTFDRELYLAKAQHELFEIRYYCLILYECRFQLVSRYPAWPNDSIPPECKLYNNCIRHEKDNVAFFNTQLDILELLQIITLLCENNTKQIIPLDVVEVFGCSKGARLQGRGLNLLDLLDCKKPKLLNTRALAELALANLVCRGFVKQRIWLERKTNKNYLMSSVMIEGVVKNADSQ